MLESFTSLLSIVSVLSEVLFHLTGNETFSFFLRDLISLYDNCEKDSPKYLTLISHPKSVKLVSVHNTLFYILQVLIFLLTYSNTGHLTGGTDPRIWSNDSQDC